MANMVPTIIGLGFIGLSWLITAINEDAIAARVFTTIVGLVFCVIGLVLTITSH